MTKEELAELKRANDLKERELKLLEAVRPRNVLETISEWNKNCNDRAMRQSY